MSPDIVNRFYSVDACKETRTWEQIARSQIPQYFKSGGIAGKMLPASVRRQWKVWACWKYHPCLYALADVEDEDYMCFAYNELDKTWHPWGTNRDMDKLITCPAKPA
jgi:hypothetical protein